MKISPPAVTELKAPCAEVILRAFAVDAYSRSSLIIPHQYQSQATQPVGAEEEQKKVVAKVERVEWWSAWGEVGSLAVSGAPATPIWLSTSPTQTQVKCPSVGGSSGAAVQVRLKVGERPFALQRNGCGK